MSKTRAVVIMVLASIIAVLFALMTNGCSDIKNGLNISTDAVDSAQVAQMIQDYHNPVFNAVDPVIEHVWNLKQDSKCDSILMQMSEPKLAAVVTVLLKRYGKIIPLDIAEEYLNNRDIYDAIVETSTLKTIQQSAEKTPPTEEKVLIDTTAAEL